MMPLKFSFMFLLLRIPHRSRLRQFLRHLVRTICSFDEKCTILFRKIWNVKRFTKSWCRNFLPGSFLLFSFAFLRPVIIIPGHILVVGLHFSLLKSTSPVGLSTIFRYDIYRHKFIPFLWCLWNFLLCFSY